MKRDLFGKTELDRELAKYSGKDCEIPACQKPLSVNVFQFSAKNFGRKLCYDHQQEMREVKNG